MATVNHVIRYILAHGDDIRLRRQESYLKRTVAIPRVGPWPWQGLGSLGREGCN